MGCLSHSWGDKICVSPSLLPHSFTEVTELYEKGGGKAMYLKHIKLILSAKLSCTVVSLDEVDIWLSNIVLLGGTRLF